MGAIDKVSNFSGEKLSYHKKLLNYIAKFGGGVYDGYQQLKKTVETNSRKRVDETGRFYAEFQRPYSPYGITYKIPKHTVLNSLKKNGENFTVIFEGREYTLKQERLFGERDSPVKNEGDKLYHFSPYDDKSKTYAIWITEDGRQSQNNQPGEEINYHFKGWLPNFELIDRNQVTGEILLVNTLLIKLPLGLSAMLIKKIGFMVPDILFKKIPQVLNRAVIPCFFFILSPIIGIIWLMGKITGKDSKCTSALKKVLSVNKEIMKIGITELIKRDIIKEHEVITNMSSIDDGSLSENHYGNMKLKHVSLVVMNGISKFLNSANIIISRFFDVISGSLKGTSNIIVSINHNCSEQYIQAAKSCFTSPFKTGMKEIKNELEVSSAEEHVNERQEDADTPNVVTQLVCGEEKNAKTQKLQDAKKHGKSLKDAGMQYNEEQTIDFSQNQNRVITRNNATFNQISCRA